MRILNQSITVIIAINIFTGCINTGVFKPAQLRYESPEVVGKNERVMSISFNPESKPRVAINSSADFTNPSITTAGPKPFPTTKPLSETNIVEIFSFVGDVVGYTVDNMDVNINYGLGDKAEFYVDTQHGNAYFRGKYQFIGMPANQAGQGNLSLALDFGYGQTESDVFTSISSNVYDAALIAGYRLQDDLLIYGGPYMTRIDITDTNDSAKTNVKSQGANIGLRFGWGNNNAMYLEAARGSITSASNTHNDTYVGLSIEFLY